MRSISASFKIVFGLFTYFLSPHPQIAAISIGIFTFPPPDFTPLFTPLLQKKQQKMLKNEEVGRSMTNDASEQEPPGIIT